MTNSRHAQFSRIVYVRILIVYVRPSLIASSYHKRASSRHRPCQIVFRWRQKHDDDMSRTAVGSEFQAVGPDTEKLRDPYRDSR